MAALQIAIGRWINEHHSAYPRLTHALGHTGDSWDADKPEIGVDKPTRQPFLPALFHLVARDQMIFLLFKKQ